MNPEESGPHRSIMGQRAVFEAGGYAVRRTSAWAVVGCVLLGLSGCAGFPQRLDWSSHGPTATATETSAPSRFTSRRQPEVDSAASDPRAGLARFARTAPAAEPITIPGDVWPESRSEWLVRHFPLLSRHWSGHATPSEPDTAPKCRADIDRVSARSRRADRPDTVLADDEVRPADALEDDDRRESPAGGHHQPPS